MGNEHNVFISWSGPQSKWVAEAIRDWLPKVLQAAKPWMSDKDIEPGSRGLPEITNKLEGMKVGIVCLTPENLTAPWILYEAGALTKTIADKPRLCTYLLGGLQFQDVQNPLGMFQATNSDKEGTQKLVGTINGSVGSEPVPEKHLDVIFEKMWPDLEKKLKTMPKSEAAALKKRPPEEIMTEILEIARGEANNRKALESRLSEIESFLNHRLPALITFGASGPTGLVYGPMPSIYGPTSGDSIFSGKFDIESEPPISFVGRRAKSVLGTLQPEDEKKPTK